MKKLYALSILLIIVVSFSYGQKSFCPAGAVWHYDFWQVGSGGFTRIEYQRDTVIQGISCKMLRPIQYEFFVPTSNIHLTHYLSPEFIYQNGDTIFWYNNSQFRVLYNFGAQPGDEWVLDSLANDVHCDTLSIVHVDSIGTSVIMNESLKWVSVHTTSSSSGIAISGKIYEQIGSEDFLFPSEYPCIGGIYDGPIYAFHCYEDNSYPLYNALAEECEYYLHVGIKEEESNSLMYLSPNPATNQLTIHASSLRDEHAMVCITNVLGQEASPPTPLQRRGEDATIDISKLHAGIYFVQLRTDKGSFTKKFIKE